MASVNQTRPHCVNQMGKAHCKPLAAWHGHGMLCVNRPLPIGEEAGRAPQAFRKWWQKEKFLLCTGGGETPSHSYTVVHIIIVNLCSYRNCGAVI